MAVEERPGPEGIGLTTGEAGMKARAQASGGTGPDEGPIRAKRIYRAARQSDGTRILVDRLWPRGISRERARLDAWMKEIAPSDGLRRWYHANRGQWEEFRERYLAELGERSAEIGQICEMARSGVVTLLYASTDSDRNNATVLREYLLDRIGVG